MRSSVFGLFLNVGLIVVISAILLFIWNRYNSYRFAGSINVTINNTIDDTLYIFDQNKFFSGSLMRYFDQNENPFFIKEIKVIISPHYVTNMVARHRHTLSETGESIYATAVSVGYYSDREELELRIFLHPSIENNKEKNFFLSSSFLHGYFYGYELKKEREDANYQANYNSAADTANTLIEEYVESEDFYFYVEQSY